VLPDAFAVLVVHVADVVLALLWIAEATEGHVVRLLVIAEIFFGIESAATVQGAHRQAGFA